jgi:hypothetical protein
MRAKDSTPTHKTGWLKNFIPLAVNPAISSEPMASVWMLRCKKRLTLRQLTHKAGIIDPGLMG